MRGKQEEERNIERFSSLEAQISLLLNKQAQQDEKIQELNERIKELEKGSGNKLLEKRINDLEQEKLRKNVEIINIDNNTDPLEAVIKLGQELDISIEKNDIKKAYRTKNNRKIIVKFKEMSKKIEYIVKNKKKKNMPSTSSRGRSKVYINDELTPTNRKILWCAKQKAKECSWRYVWVKEGKIFMRKDEKNRPTLIQFEEELNQIK